MNLFGQKNFWNRGFLATLNEELALSPEEELALEGLTPEEADIQEEAEPSEEKELEYYSTELDSEALPDVPLTSPSDMMPQGENELHVLRERYYGRPVAPGKFATVLYSSFMLDGEEPAFDQKAFLMKQQKKAHQRLQAMAANPHGDLEWEVEVTIQQNGLEGWAFIYPPFGAAPAPTLIDLLNSLKQQNITYGVDINQIHQIIDSEAYFKLIVIARGYPPVDGVDGKVVDHIPRERQGDLFDGTEDVVNFKELNLFRQVVVGEVLCDIVPYIPHEEGIAVNGKPLKARPGRAAKIPKGKNTQLSEDGTKLTATVDGQVYFQNGLFHVTQLTDIPGSVDVATGNIDVIGDVMIHGDVLSGYSVKATGDIIVYGSVEDSVLVAGGSIRIQQGMNGSGTGSLRARENIYSKFLENATVWAGLCVKSDCIINCNVSSNGKVEVTTGKGIIVGGNTIACLSVEARAIGSLAQNHTTMTIGTTAELLQEKAMLENSIRAVENEMQELDKNISFMARTTNPAPQYKELFNALKIKRSTLETRVKLLLNKWKQMQQQQNDYSKCYIKCMVVHPITHISIGAIQKNVNVTMENCYFHLGIDGIEAKPSAPVLPQPQAPS